MPESSPEDVKTEVIDAKAPAAEVKTTQDVASTESSTAEPKGEKGDMLAAVKAALAPKAEKTPASDEQGSQSDADPAKAAAKEGGEAGEESDDLSEEELERLRPKTRKRIENLLRGTHERDRKIAELEPAAEGFWKISRFVEDAGLSQAEVNDLFNVGRDLKLNPLKAHERLKPIFRQLEIMAGDALPEDLHEAVLVGKLTEAHAKELARTRSTAAISTAQVQRIEQRQESQAQQETVRAHVAAVSGAVSAWERQQEKSDPDWKLKQSRVTELIELSIMRRRQSDPSYFPKTNEEAVALATDALKTVNAEMKRFAPARREIKAHPETGSPRSSAKPSTMLEAAKQALVAVG